MSAAMAKRLKAVKARCARRDAVSRSLFRKEKTIEALLRLWLRSTAVGSEYREQVLRDVLGNEFDEYVEVES